MLNLSFYLSKSVISKRAKEEDWCGIRGKMVPVELLFRTVNKPAINKKSVLRRLSQWLPGEYK